MMILKLHDSGGCVHTWVINHKEILMAKGTVIKKNEYKATDSFKKTFTANSLGISDELYKALKDGESTELKDVSSKILNYLTVNNFIEK